MTYLVPPRTRIITVEFKLLSRSRRRDPDVPPLGSPTHRPALDPRRRLLAPDTRAALALARRRRWVPVLHAKLPEAPPRLVVVRAVPDAGGIHSKTSSGDLVGAVRPSRLRGGTDGVIRRRDVPEAADLNERSLGAIDGRVHVVLSRGVVAAVSPNLVAAARYPNLLKNTSSV